MLLQGKCNDMERTQTKQQVFENKEAKKYFRSGLKLLAASLPLLFFAPILITIGFKALQKSGVYWVLGLGCLLGLLTIIMVIHAFRLLLKSLFRK